MAEILLALGISSSVIFLALSRPRSVRYIESRRPFLNGELIEYHED